MGCPNATSGCRVRAYKHWNQTGPNHGVGENNSNTCRKECRSCINWGGISSYNVLNCPETTVIAGHYRENAYSHPMGSAGPLPYALAVSGRQNMCCGWDNNLWGFTFHKVRNKNGNEI